MSSIIDPRNKKSNQTLGDANLLYAASTRAPRGSAAARGLFHAFLKLLTRAQAQEQVEERKKAWDRVKNK